MIRDGSASLATCNRLSPQCQTQTGTHMETAEYGEIQPRQPIGGIGDRAKRILLAGVLDAQTAYCIGRMQSMQSAPAKSENLNRRAHRFEFGLLASQNCIMPGFKDMICHDINPTDNRAFDEIISQYDAAAWFALTPMPDKQTREGMQRDIELFRAFQLTRTLRAHAQRTNHNIPLIFVTRIFPDDARKLGEPYGHWRKLHHLFNDEYANTHNIRLSAEMSENDAIFVSLFEHAMKHSSSDADDISWLNLSSPCAKDSLSEMIVKFFADDDVSQPKQVFAVGECIVSYEDIIKSMRNVLRGRHMLSARLRCIMSDEAKERARLLASARAFHAIAENMTPSFDDNIAPAMAAVERAAEDIADEQKMPIHLLLEPGKMKTTGSKQSFDICRIAHAPKRSLRDTAELFMHWLPSYFKKSLNIEKIRSDVLLCKLLNATVCEIEHIDDAPFFSRLAVYRANRRSPLLTVSLAMQDAKSDDGGVLLIAWQTPSDNRIWRALFGRTIGEFGKFVREYC